MTDFQLVPPEIPWSAEEWARASRYTYTVWWSRDDDHYLARCVEIPEAISHGATPDEALHNVVDAVAGFIDVAGKVPPPASGDDDAVGARQTSSDVASQLGISIRRVQALAQSRGVGTRRGRSLLFSDADIDAMRTRQPGRPSA